MGVRRPADPLPSLGRETRTLLRQHDLLPRKGLSQSFLIAPSVRDLILRAAGLEPDDVVVEIGPGTGVLTQGLADRAGTLVAIERDPGLHRLLVERFGDRPGVSLICADALAFDYSAILGDLLREGQRAKLVSNLPYSVATPIILRLLRLRDYFSFLLVMVQREVAQRLLAAPGQEGYSALTLRCRYEAEATTVAQISRTAFYPRPAVDSTLVRLDLLSKPRVAVRRPDLLFRVVRAAFGQRRKTLRNALVGSVIVADPKALQEALNDVGIDPKRRGETLDLHEFARLTGYLEAMVGIETGQDDDDVGSTQSA